MRRVLASAASLLTFAACGADEQRVAPYDAAPVPAVPDRTAAPAEGALSDGQYWAISLVPGDTSNALSSTLVQAYFGPACVEALGESGCTPEPGVDAEPRVQIEIDPETVILVTVVGADRRNYSIPVAELVQLVDGATPDPLSPAGFVFDDDPFLLTVSHGVVTEINQIWVG